jgi:hypothetical protein
MENLSTCREGFDFVPPDYPLHLIDPVAWKGILLNLLSWLDQKQADLSMHGPGALDFTAIKIHPESFRCMTLGARPVIFAVEHFSMHFQNALACALAYCSAGTSLLREQRFFLCSGQRSYRLSADGEVKYKGTHCASVAPDRPHSHHGYQCDRQPVKFSPRDTSSALSAYLFTIDQCSGQKFVSQGFLELLSSKPPFLEVN